MKTILYLPILALIILCSCKGNSFLKQRYTKFAHNANKTIQAHPVLAKSETNDGIAPTDLQRSDLAIVSASADKGIRVENIIQPTYSTIRFCAAQNTVQTNNLETTDNSNQIVKEKKVTQQKSQLAKRLLGTLFKIVLWIIILAVVVGIIIIIGALA